MIERPTSARGRLRSSPLGGVPTVLPAPDAAPTGQLALGFDDTGACSPRLERPLPGVALVRDWLDVDEQRALVEQFRRWAVPPAGLRRPRVPAGHVMSVQSVCLGWHWQPYVYSRTADDTDGAPVKPLPDDLRALARRAVVDVQPLEGAGPTLAAADFRPDAAIVNLYEPGSKLGLHQDGEEPSAAPVVTISLGDTATFRLAGVERRTSPFTDLALRSGDLLVFGGVSRRIFHGVTRVFAGTSPAWLPLRSGRLSITVRETGFG